MKRSKFFVLALVAVMVLGYVGGTTSARQDQPLKITLVLPGTLGDKSFLDSAQRGMDMLVEDGYNVEINTIELNYDPAAWETGLSDAMIDTDAYDLLITGTDEMAVLLGPRAHLYPDKAFISFDAGVAYDDPEVCVAGCKNVYSVLYAQNEGSFLAGVYAAAMTTSNLDGMNPDPIIGALGGQDIPVINDFIVGYEQGACLVNPDSQVLVQYPGNWNDPAKGKEMTLAMYEQKADIVFNVAGQTGIGIFEAAQEQNHYAIGVDSDQASIIADTDPDQANHILTSMQKNVDMSLYRAVDLYLNGELPLGQQEIIGIAEGGVGLAENDIYYNNTPENVLDLIDAVTAAVENGDITINTVFADRVDMGYNLVDGIGVPCSDMPATNFDPSMYLGG
jgi:basic membrane protein A